MKLPAYSAYKPSGVKWLGTLPEHWKIKRLKFIASANDDVINENTPPNWELLYVDIGGVDAVAGITTKEKILFEDAPSRARRLVSDGDTIVSTVRTYLRAIAPIRQPEPNLVVSTGFAVIRPRRVEPDFLSYCLRSDYFVESVVSHSTGVSYPATTSSEVLTISVPLPRRAEQVAIAKFLDLETGRIERLVGKKLELIERLKEKRTALISYAITRGLPPVAARAASLAEYPSFKPTGIDWLRDIPSHWDVLPFTKYVDEKSDYRGKTPDKQPHGVFLVTAKNVRMGFIDYYSSQEFVAQEDYDEIMRRGLPKKGDILFTTEAPLGNVALVDREDIALAQRIIRFRMNPSRFNSKFTLFAMMSDHFQVQLKSLSTGSTAEGLKASKLPILRLVAPPLREQVAIAAYLEVETAKLDALVANIGAAIERLQEYRTALITAAVTGKIDVSKAAA